MKAPKNLDPDIRTVLEILQHAGEIVSRLPLGLLLDHLSQEVESSPWRSRALRLVENARDFELARGSLAAEEARVEPPGDVWPDDALPMHHQV